MHSAISTEKRQLERVVFSFPARTLTGIIGETVDFSRGGMRFAFQRPLLSTRTIPIQVDFPFSAPLETHVEILWNKSDSENNRYLCGTRFLRLKKNEEDILNEAVSRYVSLDREFVSLTVDMRNWLVAFKLRCDDFDSQNPDDSSRSKFAVENYPGMKLVLDEFFKNLWARKESIRPEDYQCHEHYYWDMLGYHLIDLVELGRFMHRKPLGYAGDFMIMNYFYDYIDKYLGASSFEKMLNFYVCNVPIAYSVVERKGFFKSRIVELLKNSDSAKVLSVASGPARELTELVAEGKITKPLYFDCLDVEPATFEYIKKALEKEKPENKRNLHIRFLQKDFISIIKGKDNKNLFEKYDFIYSSGLFDYLTDRLARRVISYLFGFLNNRASLVVTNANDDDYHRALYEMLAGWNLIHRNEGEMLAWKTEIKEDCRAVSVKLKTKRPFMFWILDLQRTTGKL